MEIGYGESDGSIKVLPLGVPVERGRAEAGSQGWPISWGKYPAGRGVPVRSLFSRTCNPQSLIILR
ncbi:hypothetical protein ASZ90_010301 [hydrocarbon metagenome]|uniref:Uncharacterized protein n=1 Tax=hydrocarbon metagenome TaxID=938273 RepID=A0A0W8FGI4_9ZZZZ